MQLSFELELMIDGEQVKELDKPDEPAYLYHAVEYRLGLSHCHRHLLVEVQQNH